MAEPGDELDAAEVLVIEAARELAKIDPEHDLLRLLGGRKSDQPKIESGEITDAILEAWREERYDRFWNHDEPWRKAPRSLVKTVTFANLALAIEAAVAQATPP